MNNIIKALNLTEGAVLTLEKMEDRMEFEAMAVIAGLQNIQKGDPCATDTCWLYVECKNCWDVCDCKGPVRYINQDECRPYRVSTP